MRYAALLFLAVTALATPAFAQEARDENACTAAWEKRESTFVTGMEPTVAVGRFASLRLACDVISIYFRYSKWDKNSPAEPRVYHFARLISVSNGAATERWADSRKCPALGNALKSLAAVEPPPVRIPGYLPPADGPITIQFDGDSFRLHNLLGPEFGGNQASPLGQWTYDSLKSLADCWSSQRPAIG